MNQERAKIITEFWLNKLRGHLPRLTLPIVEKGRVLTKTTLQQYGLRSATGAFEYQKADQGYTSRQKTEKEVVGNTTHHLDSSEPDNEPVENLPFAFKEVAVGEEVCKKSAECPEDMIRSSRGRIVLPFAEEVYLNLKKISKGSDLGLFILLVSGINLLLYRYTGIQDLIIGSLTPKKTGNSGELVFFRNQLTEDLDMKNVISLTKGTILEAFNYGDYSFKEMYQELVTHACLEDLQLFNVAVLYNRLHTKSSLKYYFDLCIGFLETDDTLKMAVDYNSQLYSAEVVKGFCSNFSVLFTDFSAKLNLMITKIPLLSEEEKEILTSFNKTELNFPTSQMNPQTIQQMVKAQVLKSPEKIAISFLDESLTYRELDERAEQLAIFLRTRGVTKDTIVGIMAPRSLELMVGLFGILKAGGAYLPIDPAYPTERIEYMLSDSRTKILITHSNHIDSNSNKDINFSGEIVDLAYPEEWILDSKSTVYSADSLDYELGDTFGSSEDLAYVIYTSGSTGEPKGVMLTHGSVLNLISGFTAAIDYSSEKSILCLTTISFDIFVAETWIPLTQGMRIILASDREQQNLGLLKSLLMREQVQMVQLTPSRLKLLLEDNTEGACLQGVSELIVGGEPFPKHLYSQIRSELSPWGKVYNVYGPTETTVWSSVKDVTLLDDPEEVTIGKPIANTQFWILNSELQLQPIGVFGEMYIAGKGLARGYLNREDLTQERFIEYQGMRLYRTGDLGRWLYNGELDIQGRVDLQVKIRGYRIEIGEIESQILTHPEIDSVVVSARESHTGDQVLAAYYVQTQKDVSWDSLELRTYLAHKLPEYMIPSYFVCLEVLPLTPNGKVDRQALPDPTVQAKAYIPPESELEKQLVEIWAEILGVNHETIGLDTNFFALGGHSLIAFQIISKIQKSIKVALTIPQFFGASTIRQLCQVIKEAESIEFIDLEQAPQMDHYPVTYHQHRLWTLYQLDPMSAAYNITGQMELNHEVDEIALKMALDQISHRHASLRTGFIQKDDQVVQYIREDVRIPLKIIDLSELTPEVIVTECIQIYEEEARTPFDLEKIPLMRGILIKKSVTEYCFIFNLHHIIADGRSLEILQQEFGYYYEGYRQGLKPELEAVSYQYTDFAVWQQQQLFNPQLKETAHKFWSDKLVNGLPVLDLPHDYIRTSKGVELASKTAGYRTVVQKPILAKLKRLARENHTTLFMVLFSSFNILLSYLADQKDVVIGIVSAGRDHLALQNIIGYFTTSLLHKTTVLDEECYHDFLQRVDQETQAVFQHQSYPLELVLDDLKMPYPHIPVLFNLLNVFESTTMLELDSVDAFHLQRVQDNKFDLELYLTEYQNGMEIHWNYRNAFFKPGTIEYLAQEYLNLLEDITENSHRPIQEYSLFTRTVAHLPEQIRPTNEFTEFTGELLTLTSRFETQVQRYPEKLAVKTLQESLTYSQLNNLANQIAEQIVHSKPGTKGVALLFEHGVQMIAGIFGVLKAGQYYIPLVADYPLSRLIHMIEDSAVDLILTDEASLTLGRSLIEHISRNIELVNVSEYNPDQKTENLSIRIQPDDLAYIIYTSGSTGTPKGVIQNHRNVMHFIKVYTNNLHIHYQDRLTLLASYGFDAAVMDIFGALLNGATLYPFDLKTRDLTEFLNWMRDEQITIYHSIPTVYRYLTAELAKQSRHSFSLNDLRLIVLGGEAVKLRDVYSYKEYFAEHCLFVNGLGPTESTVTLQYFINKETEIDREALSVGFPVEETEVYLMRDGREARVFEIGELVFKSDYLALGYLNQPEKTDQVFVTDPIKKTGRVYLSGDLGRRLIDGSIEFIGRKDSQIKVRGYRIEPGEIEAKILKHPEIQETVVVGREAEDGTQYLSAYVVSDVEIASSVLRDYLADELPDYMIPTYFVRLKELPLTSTGKIDRLKLPVIKHAKVGVSYIAPENTLEEELTQIWADILLIPVEDIGIYHNFFELGGHSLKATRMISLIHKEYNVRVPLAEFFKHPSIKRLAEYIKQAVKLEYTAIEAVQKAEYYPLSSAQKRLYILQQMEVASTSYNLPTIVVLEGRVDLHRLHTTFTQLLARHESLRTSLLILEGEPVQQVHEDVDFKIETYSLDHGEIKELIQQFIRPFDLTEPPLIRVGLIKLTEVEHLLMIDLHHSIADGTSLGILVEDFMHLYTGQDMAPLRIQYKDYAVWQNSSEVQAQLQIDQSYWVNEFSEEVIPLYLPTDYKRPGVQSFAGDVYTFDLSKEVTTQLRELAIQEGATLYGVLLTAYTIFLSKVSGQEEIIIGTPVAGRNHRDLESIIGMFVNTLAIKNCLSGDLSLRDMLHKVSQKVIKAFEHQEYPLEELIQNLDLTRDLSRNPLFDVVFGLQNMEIPEIQLPELSLKPYNFKKHTAKFDLSLIGMELEQRLVFNFEYCLKLFKRDTIERFSKFFCQVIHSMLEKPEQRIEEVELISEAEKEIIINQFNATQKEYPKAKLIHQLFEESAELVADKPALVFEDKTLTYRQLNQLGNCLARTLRALGVMRDTIVPIIAETSVEIIVGLIGILKAGGAYLSIDPNYPEQRKRFILEDTNSPVVLTMSHLLASNQELLSSAEVVCLDKLKIDELADTNLPLINQPTDLSYVIYTSGTTGNPKGVMVSHQNVVRLVKNTDYTEFRPEENMLQFGVLQFDASIFEIWGALLNQMTLYLIDKQVLLDFDLLQQRFAIYKPGIMFMTTTLFNQLSEVCIEIFGGIRHLMVGGETVSPIHMNRVQKRFPNLQLSNIYGPTENTTFSTIYNVSDISEDYTESIPIGKPIANSTAYVLNSTGGLQPIGLVGELYVGGDGVARGYLNQPELTESKFIPSPFRPGEKLYKTGDLVRWLSDGNLDFVCRKDHQVKIRGYRIELGGIEAKLLSHHQISQTVVLVRENDLRDRVLIAYVVTRSELTTAQIKSFLENELPHYMIPDYILILDELPRNRNGKIDRKALPLPEEVLLDLEGEYVHPTNQIEEELQKIWGVILGGSRVSVTDNFFEMGGHSLKATQMILHIYQELQIKVPLSEIFKTPTIRGLAKYISEQRQTIIPTIANIEVTEKREYYCLSSAQQRLYILQQMETKSVGYNIPIIAELVGRVDRERIELTLEKLIQRHESLRTSFDLVNGQTVQKVWDSVEFAMEYYETADAEVEQLIHQLIQPFELSVAPLFRVGLIQINEKRHILVIDMHHIISDGTSLGIFAKEFMALYANTELPPLRIQYVDYAEWQNAEKGQLHLQKQAEHWLEELGQEELAVLNLPTDFKRPVIQSFAGSYLAFDLDKETAELKRLALDENTTLYTVLLALYKLFLSKITGQEEIIVGTPVAGRSHPDLMNLIGMFVNTLVIRTHPQGEKSFREYLAEVQAKTVSAFENQDYQLEDLIATLDIQRDLSRNPVFDVIFSLQNLDLPEIQLAELTLKPYSYQKNTSKFDLSLVGVEVGEGLHFTLEYCTKLFRVETIQRFIQYYQRILQQVLLNPDQLIQDIELISADEKEQIIHQFNQTSREYPKDKLIHQLFEEAVETVLDKLGVVYESDQLTYGELNQWANQLARILRDKGVQADTVVTLLADRSVEVIVGMLAILKAGGAYLSIDPHYPLARKQFMLEDSASQVIVTTEELAQSNQDILESREVIFFNDPRLQDYETTNLDLVNKSTDLSYVIYTSGTTGRPKGVMVTHQNVIRLVKNTEFTEYRDEENMVQFGVLQFDACTFEIWGALLNQMTLYLITKEVLLDLDRLQERFTEYHPGILFMTTALFNQISETHIDIFKGIKHLMVGGEALSPTHINRVRNRFPGLKLCNIYGPTENTTFSTIFEIKHDYAGPIPIGSPITNSTAYVVDRSGHLQPIGIVGELYVGGDGVARGYMNQPELTAEKFLQSPFRPGERLYRTGDLVRWLADGNIDFVGRIDHQVKIRGYRIELGGIEARLLTHSEISQALVMVRERSLGDKYLTAYVVVNSPISVQEIKDYLRAELAHYMIPDYIIILEQMPLSRNGKIDREALPVPDQLSKTRDYDPPTNSIESAVQKIWGEILGQELIGINDNFFELGGHSLKATQLIALIYRDFAVKLPLSEMYKNPTIAGMALYIANAQREEYSSIPVADQKEHYALSSAQKRLFILQNMDFKSVSYNVPFVAILEGQIDGERLHETFRTLVARHESLRTTFELIQGKPVQKIHSDLELVIETYQGTPDTADEIIQRFIRPFDLTAGPLMRVGLVELTESEQILLIDMHHIISDGTSVGIFAREFMSIYDGQELAPLSIQYKDYSEWQALEKAHLEQQAEYWIQEFGQQEIPILNLPTDFKRPVVQSFEGSFQSFELTTELMGLKGLARSLDTTLYTILLATFKLFLMKITGQDEVIVGTPVAGRSHSDLEKIIGMFVNTLAIYTKTDGQMSFSDFVNRVKEKTVKAFENQDYQLEDLIESLDLARDLSRNPLFDVVFTLQNLDLPEIKIAGVHLKPYPFTRHTAKFDLNMTAAELEDRLVFTLEYCTKLFTQATINRFIQYYLRIVQSIVLNPDKSLAEIELISKEEREQIIYQFNNTAREYPRDKLIHQLFEECVEHAANQLALVCEEDQLTYGELNQRANQLAHLLRHKGVKRDTIVAIMLERSVEVIIGLLAILKAGGAYLSVDPQYPESQIDFMLADSGAEILISKAQWLKGVNENTAIETVLIDDLEVMKMSKDNLQLINLSEDLSYVIYTSGTTGEPKGVMVTHQNVVRLVQNTDFTEYHPLESMVQFGVLQFDACTFEIWGALLNQMSLYLIPKHVLLDFNLLQQRFREYQPGILFMTTALFNQLAETHVEIFAGLKQLMVGGEALSPTQINKVRRQYPKLKLCNIYGPTENTTFSTIFEIKQEYQDSIPIGGPIANSTAYVLDHYGKLLPVGIVGELYVGGDGVARGYLNRPELTAERFVPSPFRTGERLYKTGDLVKWLSDGALDFVGRVDHQVKIRGYRIELNGIEARLLSHPEISQTIVIVRERDNGDKYLTAYVVAQKQLTPKLIKEYLAAELPHFMIPDYIMLLETMPLNKNGKIDRRELPMPDLTEAGREYLPPTNQLEAGLVRIWSKLLGLDGIGIDANFFELGGHSLKATSLMMAIHQEFGVQMPLQEIFHRPTIQEMASYITELQSPNTVYSNIRILKTDIREYYPLSSTQKSFFIFNQKVEETTAYNMPAVYFVNGHLDRHRFALTLKGLVQRHEALRTSFRFVNGEPVQMIHSDVEVEVLYLNTTIEELPKVLTKMIKPFDLSKAPLFRVSLIETDSGQVLFYDMHHIISDGTSSRILIRDFAQLYKGETLPELKIQYKDYAVWQSEQLISGTLKEQEAFWLQQFAQPVSPLNLPTDYQRRAKMSFNGDTLQFSLNKEDTLYLEELNLSAKSTMFMTLLAIFNVFLLKYANSEDVVVGTPIAGRVHQELTELIGVFINTLALRNSPDKEQTFLEFLAQVKENTLKAYDNQEYQYEMLLSKLDLVPELNRNPLFDVMFVFINLDQAEEELQELEFTPYSFDITDAKYDITLYGQKNEGTGELNLTFRYKTQLFSRETMEKLAERFLTMIREVCNQPEVKLGEVSGISTDKQEELLKSVIDDLEDEW